MTGQKRREYQWSSAQEWMLDYIDRQRTLNGVVSIARELVEMADGDQIQDVFQAEMARDGYFTKGRTS